METQRKGLDAADTGNKRACLLCRAIARCCRAKPYNLLNSWKLGLTCLAPCAVIGWLLTKTVLSCVTRLHKNGQTPDYARWQSFPCKLLVKGSLLSWEDCWRSVIKDPFRLRKPLFSPLNYGDPYVVGEYTAWMRVSKLLGAVLITPRRTVFV